MKFVDLHLCAPWTDLEKAKYLIAKSAELGYNQIGVPIPASAEEKTVNKFRQVSMENGLDLVTRLDLVPKTPGELLAGLRKFRRKFEVVSVLCSSKAVARQAAKDRRVDLLSFHLHDPKKRFFDRAEAEVALASSVALEIDMTQLLDIPEGYSRVGLFTRLQRETATAKSFNVPIVFSSGASQPLLLRKPHDYAALTCLFTLETSLALEGLTANPAGIVERNREKLSSGYVAPGIRVVKETRKL